MCAYTFVRIKVRKFALVHMEVVKNTIKFIPNKKFPNNSVFFSNFLIL